MKKVLILANSSVGLYSFRNELLLELVKEYEVYASFPDNEHSEDIEGEGVHVIHTPINRRGVNPVEDMKLMSNYIRLLKKIKPDIVLTYTIKPNVYGGMACAFCKVPYLANVTGMGSALENGGLLRVITMKLYSMGLRKARTVFMQNKNNMEFFEKNHITKSPLRLLPGSGVNTEKFAKQEWPEGQEFVFISRVMKEKGIEEYLQCAKTLHDEGVNAGFHVIGPCEEAYEQKLRELSGAGVINYHGSVKDVRPYLEDIKCLIHPSYHEGMSNVCLEAASSGKAVITTDRPGCRETVVDGKTGFTVKAESGDALTEAVRKFMALTEEEQRAMGEAGRAYVMEHFDRKIVINAYLEEIKRNIK